MASLSQFTQNVNLSVYFCVQVPRPSSGYGEASCQEEMFLELGEVVNEPSAVQELSAWLDCNKRWPPSLVLYTIRQMALRRHKYAISPVTIERDDTIPEI